MNLSPKVAGFFSTAALFPLLKDAVAVKDNIPCPLPPAAYAETPSTRVVGTEVAYFQTTNNRAAASARATGSKSKPVGTLPGSKTITQVGVEAAEHWTVPFEMIQGLEAAAAMGGGSAGPFFSQVVSRITAELQRNARNARKRIEWFRADQIHSAFANGKIWLDGSGVVLNTSSGAVNTIDFGITNTFDKNSASGTGFGDWSTASTDIGAYMRAIDRAAVKATGYVPTTILYGANIPSYIYKNTIVKAMTFNPLLNQMIMEKNEIPDGFLGKKWVPAYKAFSGNSSASYWFGDTSITAIPDIDEDWFELIPFGAVTPVAGVASGQVMNAGDPAAMVNSVFEARYGLYSYAYANPDPVQLNVVNGGGWLPAIKVPGAPWIGTVG